MTRTYISGGMSGLPDLNFPAFHKAAASLRACGHDVVNPAELDDADPKDLEWHQYLRRDLAHLVTCDAIAMLPGWEKSKGARLEHHVARELGMRLIFLTQEARAPEQVVLEKIAAVESELVSHWAVEMEEINQICGVLRPHPEPPQRRRWWWPFGSRA